MMRAPQRRRFLQITAGLAALGIGTSAPERLRYRWTGSALGATAALDLYHVDPARAKRLVAQTVAEIDRLETVFSLQRETSALSRLNRGGRLTQPPLELVAVLEAAALVSQLSDGAFDVTVQPLWRLFAAAGSHGMAAEPRAIERARALVGWRAIDLGRSSIRFRQAGMAATLNGIAQGYITDRVTELLRDAGVEDVLVDLGEFRAASAQPPGRVWRLGTPVGPVLLADRALAVSSAGPADCCLAEVSPHLISPLTGAPVHTGRCTVVTAPCAMLADAASTALAVAEPSALASVTARLRPLGIGALNPQDPTHPSPGHDAAARHGARART